MYDAIIFRDTRCMMLLLFKDTMYDAIVFRGCRCMMRCLMLQLDALLNATTLIIVHINLDMDQ